MSTGQKVAILKKFFKNLLVFVKFWYIIFLSIFFSCKISAFCSSLNFVMFFEQKRCLLLTSFTKLLFQTSSVVGEMKFILGYLTATPMLYVISGLLSPFWSQRGKLISETDDLIISMQWSHWFFWARAVIISNCNHKLILFSIFNFIQRMECFQVQTFCMFFQNWARFGLKPSKYWIHTT